MNLISMLSSELAHQDWTIEEKSRYLYLRCCELFTYDPRFKYSILLKNNDLKQEILNKKFDLEHISDDWVVCTSHINEIYIKLLKILLGIDAYPEKLNNQSIHVWAEFYIKDKKMKADSALKLFSDLSRVKMKLQTKEYMELPYHLNFFNQLKQMDLKIQYIHKSYEEDNIMLLKQNMIRHCKECGFSLSQTLLYKWNVILSELKKYSNCGCPLNEYLCLSYLLLHLLTPEERAKIKTTELFHIGDCNNWSFANIYSVYLENDTLYYYHSRHGNQFSIYPITQAQAIQSMSRMRLAYDNQKDYILARKVDM